MQIWPHSATLSEDGATPAPPAPQAGGAGGMGAPGGPGAGAMGAGEIMLNRAESAALAALETEDDEGEGLKRAAAESGLTKEQVEKLKARAQTALKKGLTLKGVGFTKKPTPQAPDEPGLTREKVRKEPAKQATKEANTAVFTRRVEGPELYTCPTLEEYGVPVPASECEPEPGESHEANVASTLAAMVSRVRKRRQLQR